ncbi:MAG: NADH-quinone oxidoreductase subunit G, partial [Ornithinimicrobium sp.]
MTVNTSPAAGGNAVDKGDNAAIPDDVKDVTLTVDGVEVSVPEGTLVIRAAEQIGVQIPRFCDHPLLDPVGACRQCLVDVATPDREGNLKPMPKPQASCTMVVGEGMEVKTQHSSPSAEKAQHGVMELLLINHPLDCPVCDKGGECPLQNQAMSSGRPTSRFEDVKRTFPKPINISSQVLLDRERGVLCARCTRVSDQIAGDPFIALIERGALQQVGIYEEKPFESYFSGNTVQICPVGALTGSAYRFRSRPFDLVSTPSVCEHCASGCSIRTDHRRGTVLRRMAIDDSDVNEEWNCDKGRWAFTYATMPDRLRDPVVRGADGEYAVTTWNEAIRTAGDALADATAAGSSTAAVLVGGRASVEDAYAYSKFARTALGTNDIDFRARPHSDEEANFLASTIAGHYGLTYADLENASSVLLVGLEPEEESPIVFLRLRKASRKNKMPVFAVAPFATRGLQKMGGTLLSAAPGTEAEILHALGARRQHDGEAVDGPVEPLDAATTGIDPLHIASDSLTTDAVILVGERMATVPGALSAAATLANVTGAKIGWVPRRAGERGAVSVGALPNLLPGGRNLSDTGHREDVATAWGAELPTDPGRDTTGILRAVLSGEVSTLVVGGVDPDDLPDPVLARAALEKAFVISLEIRESAVHDYADVILPVAPQQEKAGSFADWEGRLRTFEKALESNAWSDHAMLDALAAQMGVHLGARSLSSLRHEMTSLGSAQSAPSMTLVSPVEPAAPAQGEAILATWHHLLDAGSMQDGEPFLAGTAPLAAARMSALTAASIGVADGGHVAISHGAGVITVP